MGGHDANEAQVEAALSHAPPAYELEAPIDQDAPPQYAETTDDGRINIDLDSRLAKTLAALVPTSDKPSSDRNTGAGPRRPFPLRLNVVIQIVGSRGDVQPFVALGQALQSHGHRVRIATHDAFSNFVLASGLEFFPIGGDPKDLMAYMVKNPGLIPSMKSLRAGDVQRKRAMMAEILDGCWKSCIEPDVRDGKQFVADAIIANPPSYAHVHCAQALGVPLHLMFTMPWSATTEFPHPLANLRGVELDVKREVVNWVSYAVVEWMTWQGLGDVINSFRNKLDLEPVPMTEGPGLVDALKIPITYCWSPALIPKPLDWPSNIDVCGFFFRDQPDYKPPAQIEKFLQAGPAPVYIGFGSIVVDDPSLFTETILEAVELSNVNGVRAIISRGWSRLGTDSEHNSENILFIDDCPHEWLFQHVSVVVHHGGAGTTACGLRNGCPTVVVPFFGDQSFWGDMVARAGAGPQAIPHRSLTSQNLAGAINFCLSAEAKEAAEAISAKMMNERGVEAAVNSFHANLPLEDMQCAILPTLPASWSYKDSSIRLSKFAAETLLQNTIITPKDLTSHSPRPITIENRRWDPLTSTASSCLGTIAGLTNASTSLLTNPYTEIKRREQSNQNGLVTTGKIAVATAKSFGKFNMHLFKGTCVDLPLATAEGFRAVPRLYGEETQSYGNVKDWKTGFEVAGRTFSHGIVDGVNDLWNKPSEDAKKEGAMGFVKGMGKGAAGFTSKTASAVLGLVAYPGEGICKSIRHVAKSATRKRIKVQKLEEGESLFAANASIEEVRQVLEMFERLRRPRESS